MNISTNDIYYENGCGDERLLYAVWHAELALVCISFYSQEKADELIFAEDFCLKTAIKLRDELTRIIAEAVPPFEKTPSAVKNQNASDVGQVKIGDGAGGRFFVHDGNSEDERD